MKLIITIIGAVCVAALLAVAPAHAVPGIGLVPVGWIESAGHPGQDIGLCLASPATPGPVSLSPCSPGAAGKPQPVPPGLAWFKPGSGGRIFAGTRLCLTRTRTHRLAVARCGRATAQRWIDHLGIAPGTIASPYGRCLTLAANPARVVMRPCSRSLAQRWAWISP